MTTYDQWKLATPPDADEEAGWYACDDCNTKFQLSDDDSRTAGDRVCGECEERRKQYARLERLAEGPEWDDPWGGTVER